MPLFSGYDLIDWGNARLTDATNFLRSIPSFFAPKPSPAAAPFTPPFLGGQCAGIVYEVLLTYTNKTNPNDVISNYPYNLTAPIGGTGIKNGIAGIYSNNGVDFSGLFQAEYYTVAISSLRRLDNLNDNCGNVPNPNPSLPIADDGLFTPNNPVIGDENGTLNPAAIVLSPAAPIIAIGGGLALAAAAAAAAKAASDALEAIKKVAEALGSLKKLWEKLQEFLEEWDKDRPKNRDIVRQTYGNIDGDGAIDFYPLSNKNFVAIQVDIVVTEVPVGFGKYFGNMSPSRYRYKELGYISFYSISKGIIETHSIQFKRTSLIIPKTAVGFIYHFGLDNKIKGFAFGTFSVRKT